jgi:hypothetical protein
MTSPESKTPDDAVLMTESPDVRVIDKPRVLSHLQQLLEDLAKEAEADDGDA